jgi:hypothetical protein
MKSWDDKGTLMTVFTSPEFCFLIDNPTPRELNSIYQITSRCPDVTFESCVKIGKEVMFSVKQIVSPVSSPKLDSALMIFLID